jgi:radical SAM/Cys-rich protein
VREAHKLEIHIIDRCNLTILEEPGFEDMAQFLAEHRVEVVASLPCYLEENVNKQRGDGVFASSIRGLKKLNSLGYGKPETGLKLNLVYNPVGPTLPPAQEVLEKDYKKKLGEQYGIVFNELYTLANMPIKRFGSTLISKGQFVDYMSLLRSEHNVENLRSVMCRTMISVDWQGFVYDCDFNQMLELSLGATEKPRVHIKDLLKINLEGSAISIKDHCYGCTAGQGSSCGGALN